MRLARLILLVVQNLRRNARTVALACFGVSVASAILAFFFGLSAGTRRVLLGEVFPADLLEVIAPRAAFGSGLLTKERTLNQSVVDQIASRPDVRSVHPRVKLAFPARGWGGQDLFGHDFYFEVSGFLDGVDPVSVTQESAELKTFIDFEALGTKRGACATDADCHLAPGDYCARDLHQCQRPVPVIVSRHLLEIYNGSIAPAHGWPRVRNWMASRFRGLTFTVELGKSYLGDSAGKTMIRRRFQLLGLSDRATTLGITVPLGYVRRWNNKFAKKSLVGAYSSVEVRVLGKSAVTPVAAYVRSLGFELANSEAERVGLFITLATLLFALIAGAIVIVAAVSVAHTYWLIVSERRREIGVLRTLGANRGAIRTLVLGEAAGVGFVGGCAGIVLALGAARACDTVAERWLPEFPFKPDTYFEFSWATLAVTVAFAVLCSVLGAWGAAQRAARIDPAQAATGMN